MAEQFILSLDQGTTSCRAILFDKSGKVVSLAQQEFTQHFPQTGWVEHDATEIWEVQKKVMLEAAAAAGEGEIAGIGITNQRETTVVWDRQTGKPLHHAIVWQCRRTAELCEQLVQEGWGETIRKKTGLVTDAYFSATKLKWILENHPDIRDKAEQGDALFGTIDSWLIWNLTGGQVHVTDISNASRTMMFNIHTRDWDDELLQKFGIPRSMLPEVRSCSEVYGRTSLVPEQPELAIAGSAGDQHAALFGQGCFKKGMAKNTYGTGCFMLMNTGEQPIESNKGLLTTIAWELDGQIEYALEGSVFTAGAVIQWLRDGLGVIDSAQETEGIALSVEDTNGVYFVPAFTGLGTPYWNPHARGMITGLSRGTTKAHVVRAALEAIAYQSVDVLKVMEEESGIPMQELRVDGGAVKNEFLMQFQADLIGTEVSRPKVQETTALGAAFLAGLAVGIWNSKEEIQNIWSEDGHYKPAMTEQERKARYDGWKQAVSFQLS
ncbi:glycerol kinase GlpK [Paenibacillus senegalensis]|uniref:glycerol kinase GlpK n=1 Tax=Paenibacillus senegalensis TaxID=1465766 RepID=UPI00028A106F|nr:glycerol kinase GlpK [Paenibacillus senegalensis]